MIFNDNRIIINIKVINSNDNNIVKKKKINKKKIIKIYYINK